jgi:hypothetical protein
MNKKINMMLRVANDEIIGVLLNDFISFNRYFSGASYLSKTQTLTNIEVTTFVSV